MLMCVVDDSWIISNNVCHDEICVFTSRAIKKVIKHPVSTIEIQEPSFNS
jgi:hypothetical protein